MTLGSFAVSPIYAMRRMGFYMTKEEEEAYVAAWRHIGYAISIFSPPGQPVACTPPSSAHGSLVAVTVCRVALQP
jgi:hypothetical protein